MIELIATELIILLNILAIPIYYRCEDWKTFVSIFATCQVSGIFSSLWIAYKGFSDEYIASCIAQGEAYKLFYE